MPVVDPAFWSELQRQTLARYDEALLRQVAARLVKPRNQWPVEDLIERGAATARQPRRHRSPLTRAGAGRPAAAGADRPQPAAVWNLGNLVEMMIALGHADGLQPRPGAARSGLALSASWMPQRAPRRNGESHRKIKSFEQWLAAPGPAGLLVFAPPQIAVRAIGEDLGLPDLSRRSERAARPRLGSPR